jgi:hypothetical protein
VLLSSSDSFPHLIQKRRWQLGFVTYLLNCPRISSAYETAVSAETPGKPGRQLYCYTAYVLAVWVGIFMVRDVINESAPSKSAALRISVVPGHTQA